MQLTNALLMIKFGNYKNFHLVNTNATILTHHSVLYRLDVLKILLTTISKVLYPVNKQQQKQECKFVLFLVL